MTSYTLSHFTREELSHDARRPDGARVGERRPPARESLAPARSLSAYVPPCTGRGRSRSCGMVMGAGHAQRLPGPPRRVRPAVPPRWRNSPALPTATSACRIRRFQLEGIGPRGWSVFAYEAGRLPAADADWRVTHEDRRDRARRTGCQCRPLTGPDGRPRDRPRTCRSDGRHLRYVIRVDQLAQPEPPFLPRPERRRDGRALWHGTPEPPRPGWCAAETWSGPTTRPEPNGSPPRSPNSPTARTRFAGSTRQQALDLAPHVAGPRADHTAAQRPPGRRGPPGIARFPCEPL